MLKVLKICWGTWDNASRDKRELAAYREQGAEVMVMAQGELGDKFRRDSVDGFDVYRFSVKPLGKYGLWGINRFIGTFVWPFYVRRFKADVLSCHDILALTIGWMSTLLVTKKNRPLLIYDSHEFELGRNAVRSKGQIKRIAFWEKFLMKRCAFSIMVNDSIADEVQRIHGLKDRPVVIRSTPEYWEIDPSVCESKRAELMAKFPEKVSFLMMFHGNLGRGNGIELLLNVVESSEDIGLVLMGAQTNARLVAELKETSEAHGISDRILYIPPVKVEDIWQYAGAVDLEMMLIQPIVKSYYYSLPNKFFESVQSLTPMVASDLPEMKALIDRYGIGLYCDIDDREDILRSVNKMREDREFYAHCKENLKTAKRELCWEEEKRFWQRRSILPSGSAENKVKL